MKYKFIQQHTFEFSIVKMCQVLQVSKSGYYKWLAHKPSARALYNQYLVTEIKQIHEQSKRRYGSPRIAKELAMRNIKASEVLVAKLIRIHAIISIIIKNM